MWKRNVNVYFSVPYFWFLTNAVLFEAFEAAFKFF